jgi:hypothetical protein
MVRTEKNSVRAHAFALRSDSSCGERKVEKEAETDAELEEMIRLVIDGVFVSLQPDASPGWRPTVNRTS